MRVVSTSTPDGKAIKAGTLKFEIARAKTKSPMDKKVGAIRGSDMVKVVLSRLAPLRIAASSRERLEFLRACEISIKTIGYRLIKIMTITASNE
jgi:hypothetical protein